MNPSSLATTWAPRLLSVLRIVAALLFIEHGTQKLLGFPAAQFSPAMFSLPWIASVLETFGGLALLIGFHTRVAAFVLSGEMAFAYWLAHAPHGRFPVLNGGDAAVLFCFLFLYIAAYCRRGGRPLERRRGAHARLTTSPSLDAGSA